MSHWLPHPHSLRAALAGPRELPKQISLMKKMIKLGGGVLGIIEGVGGGNEGGKDHIPLYVFLCVCVKCMCIYMKLPKDKKKKKSLNSYDTVLISFGEGIELEIRHWWLYMELLVLSQVVTRLLCPPSKGQPC